MFGADSEDSGATGRMSPGPFRQLPPNLPPTVSTQSRQRRMTTSDAAAEEHADDEMKMFKLETTAEVWAGYSLPQLPPA